MRPSRVWVYNYDFEFELAGEHKVSYTGDAFLPWYFLNRSWHALLPLVSASDEILVYEDPLPELLENLGPDSLPRFRCFHPAQESNSILDDLGTCGTPPTWTETVQFSPWGWSPKAFAFAAASGLAADGTAAAGIVRYWNAKTTSHFIREQKLPASWRIAGAVVDAGALDRGGLRPMITDFINRNGKSLVKHPFGTAGRLSDYCDGTSLSGRKVRKWENWLRKCDGILLEKQIGIKQEWSLQVDFDSRGGLSPAGLTRLYSGSAGNYTGTILTEADQNQLPEMLDALSPVLAAIAESGYIGPAGLDIIESRDGSRQLLEINCRMTMGRVALEWHRRMAGFRASFFTNLFFSSTGDVDVRLLIEQVRNTVRRKGNRVTILNLLRAPSAGNCMISLLVQGDDTVSIRSCVDGIRSRLKGG